MKKTAFLASCVVYGVLSLITFRFNLSDMIGAAFCFLIALSALEVVEQVS